MSVSYDSIIGTTSAFRILKLYPSSLLEADIWCELITSNLQDNPSYEALSYTWGDPPSGRTILLHDVVVNVTDSLFVALQYLRNADEPRYLWVDAICIDQKNDRERTQQVLQMRNIYSRASRVLVWLSGPDTDMELALKTISQPAGTLINEDELNEIAPGVQKILSSPWWTRMWTLQEMIVADPLPTVVCGGVEVDWEMFTGQLFAIGQMIQFGTPRPAALTSNPLVVTEIVGLRYSWWNNAKGKERTQERDIAANLESFLIATCSRQATDPKDHVYALLGLLPESSITPDYEDTVANVFQLGMFEAVKSGGDLKLLKHATRHRSLDLPSWCIDFSIPGWNVGIQNLGILNALPSAHFFRIERLDQPPILPPIDPPRHDLLRGSLHVTGFNLGSIIAAIEPLFDDENEKKELRNAIMSFNLLNKLISIMGHAQRLAEDTGDLFNARMTWETMAHGARFFDIAGMALDFYATESGLIELKQWLDQGPRRRNLELINDDFNLINIRHERELTKDDVGNVPDMVIQALNRSINYILILIGSGLENRSLFGTATQLYGSADTRTCSEDVLCFLPGCERLSILRPEADGRYRLICFASVPIFMQHKSQRLDGSYMPELEAYKVVTFPREEWVLC